MINKYIWTAKSIWILFIYLLFRVLKSLKTGPIRVISSHLLWFDAVFELPYFLFIRILNRIWFWIGIETRTTKTVAMSGIFQQSRPKMEKTESKHNKTNKNLCKNWNEEHYYKHSLWPSKRLSDSYQIKIVFYPQKTRLRHSKKSSSYFELHNKWVRWNILIANK